MEFLVPEAGSLATSIRVVPNKPVDSVAQEWSMFDQVSGDPIAILDIVFSKSSLPLSRLTESMTITFNIDEAVQTDSSIWRFGGEPIYCSDGVDTSNGIQFSIENNGKALIARIKSVQDAWQTFNFAFIGLHQNVATGQCEMFSSADPGGGYGRR
jgi:hypothetical protein